jgi:hypothetical protein
VTDPLCGDEELLEDIREAMKASSGLSVSNKLRGVPTTEGTLDKNQMKTLVREVVHLLNNSHAKMVKGMRPDMEDVDELDGDYLLNSRNTMDWRQPKLEKELPAWVDRLNRIGE